MSIKIESLCKENYRSGNKPIVRRGSWHASRCVRHARVMMHVGIANPRWREHRSQHPRRMRNLQVYVSGKRPMRTGWWKWHRYTSATLLIDVMSCDHWDIRACYNQLITAEI